MEDNKYLKATKLLNYKSPVLIKLVKEWQWKNLTEFQSWSYL